LWDVPKLRPIQSGGRLGIAEIIEPTREEMMVALRKNKARNPRVFGSIRRSEATARSDLDLLVDFDRGATAFDQIGLIQDLERLFRRKVEVVEPDGLHWLVRPQVLFEAESI
jgi:uncharacterized protein